MENDKIIYLDNAATSFPKPESVYQYVDFVNRNYAVNSGRGSYKLSKEAYRIIEDTRQCLKEYLSATEVVFSASVTEAINQLIFGLGIKSTDVIYYTPYEHNAVMRPLEKLRSEVGCTLIEVPLTSNLEIDLDKLHNMFIKDKPNYVFAIHVSNVTGYILPIKEMVGLATQYHSRFICDGAQAVGHIPVSMKDLGVDYYCFTGHKGLYGIFGVGGIACKNAPDFEPRLIGGTGTESLNREMPSESPVRYEASSPNVIAIGSLKKGIEFCKNSKDFNSEKKLADYLMSCLADIDEVTVYGGDCQNKIGIVSFNLEGYSAEQLAMILDQDFNIAVRSGYHCCPEIHKFLGDMDTSGTVRIGIGAFTIKENLDYLVSALEELL